MLMTYCSVPYLKALSINQDPIANVKLLHFCNIRNALFGVNEFAYIMYMVLYSSYSVNTIFCIIGGECVIVDKVYTMWVKAIETPIRREFVDHVGYGIIGKFWKRWTFSLVVLFIVVLDLEVLFVYLNCSFTESICLQVASSRIMSLDAKLFFHLF